MSTKQTVKPEGNALTARDLELLAAVFNCTKAPVEVDYARYAEKVGLKNAASGKASWHALKKKLDKPAGSGGASPSKDAPTGGEDKAPAKGSKKRKGADEDAHDAEDAAPAPKAAKKSRKGAAGAAKKKGEEAVEEDSVKEEAIKDESENDLDG